jgi:hypothetical protein
MEDEEEPARQKRHAEYETKLPRKMHAPAPFQSRRVSTMYNRLRQSMTWIIPGVFYYGFDYVARPCPSVLMRNCPSETRNLEAGAAVLGSGRLQVLPREKAQ